jgi:hypothetical protein
VQRSNSGAAPTALTMLSKKWGCHSWRCLTWAVTDCNWMAILGSSCCFSSSQKSPLTPQSAKLPPQSSSFNLKLGHPLIKTN